MTKKQIKTKSKPWITDTNEIVKVIKILNISKSNGPNSIPSKLLVTAANEISPVLTKIISISFKTGTYPDLLKIVKVPIYKIQRLTT